MRVKVDSGKSLCSSCGTGRPPSSRNSWCLFWEMVSLAAFFSSSFFSSVSRAPESGVESFGDALCFLATFAAIVTLSMREVAPPDCLTMFSKRSKGRQASTWFSADARAHSVSYPSLMFSKSYRASQHLNASSPSNIMHLSYLHNCVPLLLNPDVLYLGAHMVDMACIEVAAIGAGKVVGVSKNEHGPRIRKKARIASARMYALSVDPRANENLSSLDPAFVGMRVSFLVPLDARKRWGKEARTIARGQKTSESARLEAENSPAATLRRILATPGAHPGPACYDALSARLVEQAGFSFTFTSGFAISATRLAAPDAGLISFGEMLDQGRLVTAAVSIPVIGDGDNGYGNAVNVKRTVKAYIQAGFAGILLEDQVSPKACGHTQGRKVVSREEALTRIKAAVDARSESGTDIVIVARTDARQADSLEEALWRVQSFAEAGADVLFVDALTSKDEMVSFAKVVPNIPKMANMLEGGCTPIFSPMELKDMGFKLIAYPLSLLGVSICAMQNSLKALKSGRLPPPGSMASFEDIKELVGFNKYYDEMNRYATTSTSASSVAAAETVLDDPAVDPLKRTTVVEADDDDDKEKSETSGQSAKYATVEVEESSIRKPLTGVWSSVLHVKVTGSNGVDKLDVRIPAGFLDGLSSTIPGLVGVNLRKMVDEAGFYGGQRFDSGQRLIDLTDARGERIQVFLE